jgi:hypothetical protein
MFTDFFLYGKVAVAFLTALIDWRAAIAFLAAAALVGATCRQPHYDGAHAIKALSPAVLLKAVYDSGEAGAGAAKPARDQYQGPAWLVAFVDPKAPLCTHVRALGHSLMICANGEHTTADLVQAPTSKCCEVTYAGR